MPDLIQSDETGWVFPLSLGDLAAALDRAWLHQDAWPLMGQRAHAFIVRYWDVTYPRKLAMILMDHARAVPA